MISYIDKGWEQEEYTYNPDRERRPPVERRLKEVEVEGSLGAGMVKTSYGDSNHPRLVSVMGLERYVTGNMRHIKKVVPRTYSPFS